MGTLVNINGTIFEREKATINVFDRGFLFGDSVYEVLRTYSGDMLFLFDEHYERLLSSINALSFNISLSKNELKSEITKTLKMADNEESYIRLIITRGIGDTYLDSDCVKGPNRILIVKKLDTLKNECYTRGVSVKCVSVRRNPINSLSPVIKSGNYLNNFLAYNEAHKEGYFDGLMLNQENKVTELSTSNIFFVKDKIIKTPSLTCGILSGITRNFVLKLLKRKNFIYEEGEFSLDELKSADEIFMTSTLKEILPVTRLDANTVGNGLPGIMTLQISELFRQEVNYIVESFKNA